jgi:hypothetical protein
MRVLALLSLFSLLVQCQGHSDHHHHGKRRLTDGGSCDTHIPNSGQRKALLSAQRVWTQTQAHSNRGLQKTIEFTVPVIVHLVSDSTASHATDAQLLRMFEYLNQKFADSGAPFVFEHTKTTMTVNKKWWKCSKDNADEFKRQLWEGGWG